MPNENQNDRASFATFFLDHARGFGAQRSGAMSIAEAAASQAAKLTVWLFNIIQMSGTDM